MKTVEQEFEEHEVLKERMLQVARRMMQSKREMQEEIRQDIKKPEIRAAIDALLQRNHEKRRSKLIKA